MTYRNLEKENKNLSRDNRELVMENNKLQDDVFSLQKQRDEMQTEISELQILVEDLKLRLCQSEAEHKQLKKEEQELLAKMNVRICFIIQFCFFISHFVIPDKLEGCGSNPIYFSSLASRLAVQTWSERFDRTSMEAKMVCNR